jgi:hypothetical protein
MIGRLVGCIMRERNWVQHDPPTWLDERGQRLLWAKKKEEEG